MPTAASNKLKLRFRLRTLLIGVGLLCFFLAISKLLSAATTALLGLLIFCVVAHVAGNAIGTFLRDRPSDQRTPGRDFLAPMSDSIPFAPATGLSQRRSLGLIVPLFVMLGTFTGAGLGSWLLISSLGSKATWANLTLGTSAFAVLGGFFGFGMSTFFKVVIGANIEAWREPHEAAHSDRPKAH